MTMSSAARSAAARKAAATRRAKRFGGGATYTAPQAPRPAAAPVFTTPKPTVRGQQLVALAALEDAFVIRLRDIGITDDARKAWDRYQKVKALALGAGTTDAESATALRLALVELVKLAF